VRPEAAKALDDVIRLLKDPDRVVRRFAAQSLWLIGPGDGKRAVSALTAALKDKDFSVRSYAITALRGFGADATEAIPSLVAMLKDKSGLIRHEAARALKAIGPKNKLVIAAFIEALQDPDKNVQYYVIDALAAIGKEGKAAIPVVARCAAQLADLASKV
jgi:HEAT repeat protein